MCTFFIIAAMPDVLFFLFCFCPEGFLVINPARVPPDGRL